jgi:hypothetical protein
MNLHCFENLQFCESDLVYVHIEINFCILSLTNNDHEIFHNLNAYY